jgi:poly-gamma-glutamate synthesis protein (capsule biosynthesis protein)
MKEMTDISLLTVGDISFRGRWEKCPTALPFKALLPHFSSHSFVLANLESPLVLDFTTEVSGKCTLAGDVGWAKILNECGIDLVNLANNHMMDYGESGMFNTLQVLDDAGVLYVGAGRNSAEACSPVVKEISGRKFAFLGRSAVEVSSPCYAGSNNSGVAQLEEAELIDVIGKCREVADTVVVMLHWGLEHYHCPAPQQRALAKKLVAAGADILLGHHPHVLQGEEWIDRALVSYSSGNFLFDEFSWSVVLKDGQERVYQSTMTHSNRQGMMLEVTLGENSRIKTNQIFTWISSDARVTLDDSTTRKKDYVKLCKRLNKPFYASHWRLYSLKREWDLRLKKQLSPIRIIKNIHKIRPRHCKEFAVKIKRSSRVASGKSTNPYEG